MDHDKATTMTTAEPRLNVTRVPLSGKAINFHRLNTYRHTDKWRQKPYLGTAIGVRKHRRESRC